MKTKRIAVVTTSIGDEKVFERFFKEYGKCKIPRGCKIDFIVIGDKNSPHIDFDKVKYFKSFNKKFGFKFISWVEQDMHIMKEFPYMEDLIPWRRIQRRNIGYIEAYRKGYDFTITVDDDNFPMDDNFFIEHYTNISIHHKIYYDHKDVVWMNPCFKMDNIIHRGYPLEYRDVKSSAKVRGGSRARVALSEGFWVGDADVDAVSRLVGEGTINKKPSSNVVLSPNIIAPSNTQNTIFRTEYTPAMFLSAKVGRYDDIWASYLLKAILYVTGELVSYGKPIVKQDRNDHDIFKDFEKEVYGMKHTKEFVEELFAYVKENKKNLEICELRYMIFQIANDMALNSSKFSWYYIDIIKWVEVLRNGKEW